MELRDIVAKTGSMFFIAKAVGPQVLLGCAVH